MLSMLQEQNKADALFLVSVFAWTGCYVLGFAPQIGYQFVFTATLRGNHPKLIYYSNPSLETLTFI